MGLAFCFVSSYAPSRYYILFLPAMVFVGVSYISSFRSEWRNVAILASAFVCMAWDVCGLMNSTYSVSHAQATVRNNTRPGSTLIGEFGPELAIGSELRSAPVQPGLSNDMNPIEKTGADYVAVTRNAYWQNWWHAHASGRISWNRPLFSVTLNGSSEYIVDVYEIRRLTESGLK